TTEKPLTDICQHQVINHIATPFQAFLCDILCCKNILQVVWPQSIPFLHLFAKGHQSNEYAQLYPLIPGMGEILGAMDDVSQSLQEQQELIQACLRSFAGYLALRAGYIFTMLQSNRHYPVNPITLSLSDEDWQVTGSYYHQPVKRNRPFY